MSNSVLKMMSILAVSALVITAPNTLLNSEEGNQKLNQQLETSIEASIEQMNNKIDQQIELKLNK